MLDPDLMLLPLVVNIIFQKVCSKEYMLVPYIFCDFEIILILLIKVVLFLIEFIIVKIRITRLEVLVKLIFWLL